jgi:hypothetical protein
MQPPLFRKIFFVAPPIIILILLFTPAPAQNIALVDNPDVSIFPSGNRQGSVTMSLNRQNPNIIVVAAETRYNSNKNVGRYTSTNGGQTWSGSDILDPNVSKADWWPSTAIGTNGNIFIGVRNETIRKYLISKSSNNGLSFSPVVQTFSSSQNMDNSRMTVDDNPGSPYNGYVYTIYGQAYDFSFSKAAFRRSTDGGQTFSNAAELDFVFAGKTYDIQTGPNGQVYLCWSVGPTTSRNIKFWRSLDGGQSFTSHIGGTYQSITEDNNPDLNYIDAYDMPSMAVDKSGGPRHGRIYIAVPSKESNPGPTVIRLMYSDDQGTSWSSMNIISDAASWHCWRPRVAVDQVNGNVVVAYSSIIGDNYSTVTKIAASSDGGATFIYQQASDITYKTEQLYENELATYGGRFIGLAVHDNKAYVAWTDKRTGEWQIRFSKVDITPKVSGPTVLCGSFNYTVDFPCKGSVTWGVLNNNLNTVSISCTNCPSPTITKLGDGFVTLTATVTSTCGASPVTAHFPITSGNPFVAYPYPIGPDPNCLQKGGQILYGVNVSPYAYGSYLWGYVEGGSYGPINYVDNGGLNTAGIRINNNEQFNGIYVAVMNECGVGTQSIAVFEFSNCGYNDETWRTKKEKEHDKPEIKNEVFVSPNPVRDRLNLRSSVNIPLGSELQIFDAQGLIVYKGLMNQSIQTIDVSKLAKGTYVLQVTHKRKKHVIKFVKL